MPLNLFPVRQRALTGLTEPRAPVIVPSRPPFPVTFVADLTVASLGSRRGFRPSWHPVNSYGDLVPGVLSEGTEVMELGCVMSSNTVVFNLTRDRGGSYYNIIQASQIKLSSIATGSTIVVPAGGNNQYTTNDPTWCANLNAQVGNTIEMTVTFQP